MTWDFTRPRNLFISSSRMLCMCADSNIVCARVEEQAAKMVDMPIAIGINHHHPVVRYFQSRDCRVSVGESAADRRNRHGRKTLGQGDQLCVSICVLLSQYLR